MSDFVKADLQGLAKLMGPHDVVLGLSKSNPRPNEEAVIRALHDNLITRHEADELIGIFEVSCFIMTTCPHSIAHSLTQTRTRAHSQSTSSPIHETLRFMIKFLRAPRAWTRR